LGCRNYRDIPHPEASQIGVREAAVHGGYSFSGRHPFTSHLEIRNCCDQAITQPILKTAPKCGLLALWGFINSYPSR
jgi:hypothetical protein